MLLRTRDCDSVFTPSAVHIACACRLIPLGSQGGGKDLTVALYLDHAFITCSVGAPEAAALVERGFVEGSANVHPGQGTANRRFFFGNFMLELLWVTNPDEAASDAVYPTGLWERWSKRSEGASRFGIVYGGVPAYGSSVPFATESYRPPYLAPPMSIEIVQGMALEEPALFWISSLVGDRETSSEPTNHRASVRSISGVRIGLTGTRTLSHAARRVRDAALLDFFSTPSQVLEVRFQSEHDSILDCRPELPLVFLTTAASRADDASSPQ